MRKVLQKVVINQNKLLNAYGSQVVDQRCPGDIIMNSGSPENPLQPQELKIDEGTTREAEEHWDILATESQIELLRQEKHTQRHRKGAIYGIRS
jgi:hypothetical protein